MRAMILAAGKGARMGELTLTIPKPLLKVGELLLIEYSILNLVSSGISDIVINVHYFADKIIKTLGDGSRYGANFIFSIESERLETGGGIVKALPLLGKDPFIVVSSDIITKYPIKKLPITLNHLAHLVMVDNPSFHPRGDFGFDQHKMSMIAMPKYTFANIGVYHPDLFKNCKVKHFPLSECLIPAINQGEVTGEFYDQYWNNISTQTELEKAKLKMLEKI